jgi:hypothetical protein
MKRKEIRLLEPGEINVKPKQIIEKRGRKYVMLLLYKDSRCDMARLDEAFGSENWKREHQEISGNLYCTVSIWDEDKSQWVGKQDVGTESDVEKQKGEASDAFKRACTNWGIGRELYTAPRIYVELEDQECYKRGDTWRLDGKVAFHVHEIRYGNNRDIVMISISDSRSQIRYEWKTTEPMPMGGDKKPAGDDVTFLTRADARKLMDECSAIGIDRYVLQALEQRGLHGLSGLKTDDVGEFIAEVEAIALSDGVEKAK